MLLGCIEVENPICSFSLEHNIKVVWIHMRLCWIVGTTFFLSSDRRFGQVIAGLGFWCLYLGLLAVYLPWSSSFSMVFQPSPLVWYAGRRDLRVWYGFQDNP